MSSFGKSSKSRRSKKAAVRGEQQERANITQRNPCDLYTWGFGGQGALGNASFRDELDPFCVYSLREYGGSILVACGFDHTIAITSDLCARAWGRAAEGQLGIPATLESPRGGGCVLEPTPVGLCEGESPAAIQAVACGGMHTLLMTVPRSVYDDPVIFSCGRGAEGQLGTGRKNLVAVATDAAALELPTALPPVVVAAGGLHSAALSSHGHVFMWGDAACGQLGLPRPEASPPTAAQPSVQDSCCTASSSSSSSAAAALRMALQPASSQLNAPITSTSSSSISSGTALSVSMPHLLPSTAFEGRAAMEARKPITVSAAEEGGREFVVLGRKAPPLQVSSLACGQYHTVCCTLDGEVFAWGSNGDGQLGIGEERGEARHCPTRVKLAHTSSALQVACGGRHTFVLGAFGEVSSCGCNTHGQLGHRSDFGREPVRRLVEVCEQLEAHALQNSITRAAE